MRPIRRSGGGTYAGNPVSCAAALAVLDVFAEEKLLDRAARQGRQLKARLEKLQSQNNVLPIEGIRGLGAMVAFDVVRERGGVSEPDAEATKRVVQAAYENGLVLPVLRHQRQYDPDPGAPNCRGDHRGRRPGYPGGSSCLLTATLISRDRDGMGVHRAQWLIRSVMI